MNGISIDWGMKRLDYEEIRTYVIKLLDENGNEIHRFGPIDLSVIEDEAMFTDMVLDFLESKLKTDTIELEVGIREIRDEIIANKNT
jgi:hypothetical protein